MSFNLFDAAKSLFSHELISKASAYLGESEGAVHKGMNGIIPVVLGSLADKSATVAGAGMVNEMVQEHHNSGILGNLGNFFGDNGGLLNKGAGLLQNLFGDKLNSATSLISSYSGLKNSSTTSLFSMALPALLSLIGKHTSGTGTGNVSSFLSSQKSNIMAGMPSGLNLGNILSGWNQKVSDISTTAATRTTTAAHYAADTVEKGSNGMKWLLPLLLLILAAVAAWYLFGKGCNSADTKTTGGDTTIATINAPAQVVSGKLDSLSGDWMYNEGDTITLTLPNGGGDLKVGKYSTEARLVNFLTDANQKIDTVKGNWFEFTNVHFNTGKSTITDASQAQLKNVAAIIKAFNTAQFKLGGYTDSTGTLGVNIKVSEERAKAVEAFLIKDGVSADAFTGTKGYGPEWPIADNATPEGRAQNRRVAVNVKAK